jgi:hypothetical protein
MNRKQLEHVLRASAAITEENSFVVVGSQAVLLPAPDAPADLLLSEEIDLYPALRPEKADLIDGAIGALSSFHETFGYHADGVGPETAVMPADWMVHAQLYYIGDITVVCPDLHDLAVSKCVAAREKDAAWVRALLRHSLVSADRLLARVAALQVAPAALDVHRRWMTMRVREAGVSVPPSAAAP